MSQEVEIWLRNFKGKGTKKVYRSILRKFGKYKGVPLDEYIDSAIKGTLIVDVLADFKGFVASLDSPPKTVLLYSTVVREFLKEQGILDLSEEEWKQIKTRQQIVSVATTIDRAPTKPELRTILNYMDIKGKGLVLFLISSGARIGETVQIRVSDLDLDANPPRATIRHKATKRKKGRRDVRMSYEARDAIRDWLRIKDGLLKKSGDPYDEKLVFPFSTEGARYMLNLAVKKAGLDTRDEDTNRRELHVHSLRKFFRTNIGLDFDLTNALMGHTEYLDKSYRRLNKEQIDRAYLGAMANVSIYTAPKSRVEEIKSRLAMVGLSFEDLNAVMATSGETEGLGGGKVYIADWEPWRLNEHIAGLEDEQIGQLVQQALKQKLMEAMLDGGRPLQKVIGENELDHYLTQGWRYVSSLNNGSNKCVVERA